MSPSHLDSDSPRVLPAYSNYTQILSKAPKTTKDILHKLDVGPRQFTLCGHNVYARQLYIILALFMLCNLSLCVAYIIWCTNAFGDMIAAKMAIREDSDIFQGWIRPVPTVAKFYIFNYTNVEDVASGRAEKFNVQEVGPYVYKEVRERLNYKFSEDRTTVTYQENHTFVFQPDLSVGHSPNDRVNVPNLPLLGAAAMSQHSFYLTRLAMSGVFTSLNARPFLTIPVDRFMFGYDDNLYSLAKGMLALSKPLPFEKFGLLASRNGFQKDEIEEYTGVGDINKISMVKSINGEESFNYWQDEECNRIGGTLSGIFSVDAIRKKQPFDILYKDFGRRYTLEFHSVTSVLNNTVPVYRYLSPDNIYSHPNLDNNQNRCYCAADGTCPPHGLFNISQLSYGTPIFVSNPHFYNADPSLTESVTGLNPQTANHQSFLDVHPLVGFPLRGWSRFQTNVQVIKSSGIGQLSDFKNNMILPISWMEFGIDDSDLPADVRKEIYDNTMLAIAVEMALKYGSVLMALVTFILMMVAIRRTHYNMNQCQQPRNYPRTFVI